MNLLALLAQTSAPITGGAAPVPTTGAQPGPIFSLFGSSMMPLLIGFGLLWFLMMRSKTGDSKKRKDMLAQLKKGDRIQTIGGILGTVLEARDTDVLVKVDETSNTKMRFIRSAIARVVEEDKVESK